MLHSLHHKRVAVSAHAVEFVVAVVQQIMFVEAQLALIVNGYAAAEEAAIEVLVVEVGAIPLILHQAKMGLLMSCLRNFLCYDKMGI